MRITKPMAKKAVQQAVQVKGRQHFAQCYYESNGEPMCIVGHALFNVGVDLRVLEEMDANIATIDSKPNLKTLEQHEVTMTPAALKFLKSAQAVQDTGQTWGEALDWALEV